MVNKSSEITAIKVYLKKMEAVLFFRFLLFARTTAETTTILRVLKR